MSSENKNINYEEKHVEILQNISTAFEGMERIGNASVKILARDIIEAGRRLEEIEVFNFLRKTESERAMQLLRLRDGIIDLHYRHFNKPNEKKLIFKGGSRSGKTHNIIKTAILKNQNEKFDLNIIAPSYKMLNLGSFIDAKEIIEKYDIDCKFPASASGQIKFASGGVFTFEVVTSENEAKRNRKNVYINEADGIQKEIANLVMGRASGQTFIDFNPTKKFWVDEYITETNFLQTSWMDNPFLSENQLQWFADLKKFGENAELGSPERYSYEVYYLGNYSLLSGKAFEISDFDIVNEVPEKFDYLISYADPSLGTGADYFAAMLFGIKKGVVYALDCIFSQYAKTGGYVEQLNLWDKEYNNKIDHYAEVNGVSGVVTKAANNTYDGVLNEVNNGTKKEADIIVYSTTAKRFKYLHSDKMLKFIKQCVEFPNGKHDDAPDCLCRGAKIILQNFDLK